MNEQPTEGLAFKCVTNGYKSIFVNEILKKTYEVGNSYETRRELPMFILRGKRKSLFIPRAGFKPLDVEQFWPGAGWERLLVVKVLLQDVTGKVPWLPFNDGNLGDIDSIIENCKYDNYTNKSESNDYAGAHQLTVMDEVNLSTLSKRHEMIDFYSKKYNLSFI